MNAIFLFLYLLCAMPTTEKHTLTINISNIEKIKGTVEIGVFNTHERFLEEGQAYKSISIKVTANTQTVVVKDLPPGIYAVSMYHDVNSDGDLNRNFFGIPKEPYGFSNNFKPRFSAPKFQDCEFKLESDSEINIELRG